MSKGNMLLGHARGKVGDIVFSRSNGEQVTKARTSKPKNPRTQSQILQRVIINTVAQAYSTMQPICDHSFEGLQPGSATMSAFMSHNVKQLRARIAALVAAGGDVYSEYSYVPLGTNVFAPNAFLISKGTLPEVSPSYGSLSNLPRCVLAIGGNTYADVIATLGLKRGDQLTFVSISKRNNQVTFDFCRVILDPTTDGESADLDTKFIVDGEINAPSVRNQGSFGFLQFDGTNMYYDIAGSSAVASNVICAAVIVSRKSAGKYLRSNSYLVLSSAAIVGIGYSLGECLDLGSEGISTLSDEYLNNSGQGNIVGSGASVSQRITSVKVDSNAVANEGDTVIYYNIASEPVDVQVACANAVGLFVGVIAGSATTPITTPVQVGSSGVAAITLPNANRGVLNHVALSTSGDSSSFSSGVIYTWTGTFSFEPAD